MERGCDGKEFLKFRERLTKTRNGDRDLSSRPFERCPFFLYKSHRSHRPEAMCHEDSPFYLKPKGDDLCRRNKEGI